MFEGLIDFLDRDQVLSLSFGLLILGSYHNTVGALPD